jgi:hypothetical protein
VSAIGSLGQPVLYAGEIRFDTIAAVGIGVSEVQLRLGIPPSGGASHPPEPGCGVRLHSVSIKEAQHQIRLGLQMAARRSLLMDTNGASGIARNNPSQGRITIGIENRFDIVVASGILKPTPG